MATLPPYAASHQRLQLAIYTPVVYDAAVIRSVRLSRRAEKDLERVPGHIARNVQEWIDAIAYVGLEEVRRISGYHDEPLQGIWLNIAYRAIYRIASDEGLELVYVEKVSKHEY